MILLTSRKYAVKQKVVSFQEVGQKRKMVIKIQFTPLSLLKRVREKNESSCTTFLSKVGISPI